MAQYWPVYTVRRVLTHHDSLPSTQLPVPASIVEPWLANCSIEGIASASACSVTGVHLQWSFISSLPVMTAEVICNVWHAEALGQASAGQAA